MKCVYCLQERKNAEGWHGCAGSLDAKARIEGHIEAMTRIAAGTSPTSSTKPDDLVIGHTIKTMKAWEQDERN